VDMQTILQVIEGCIDGYSTDKQEYYAHAALTGYDYRVMGTKLATDIEHLRSTYSAT
jgi:hypothetical protein